jgi:hypothetical protein
VQGSTAEVEVDGVGRLSGEVDFTNEHFLGLRTAGAMNRLNGPNAFGAPVRKSVHEISGIGE